MLKNAEVIKLGTTSLHQSQFLLTFTVDSAVVSSTVALVLSLVVNRMARSSILAWVSLAWILEETRETETERQKVRETETERQTDRQTERGDRWTETETETETETYSRYRT